MLRRSPRALALASLCALTLTACGSKGGSTSDGGTGGDGPHPEETALVEFNAALSAYVDAVGASHAAAVAAFDAQTFDRACTPGLELIGCVGNIVSGGGEGDPAEAQAAMLDWMDRSNAGLAAASLAQRRALVRSHALFLAARPLLLGSTSSPLRPADDRLGQSEQPLIFVTLGAIVGAVLLNKALNDTMESAVEARTEPVRKKIEEGSEETLTVIKEDMGLDASATREEVLAAFEDKPVLDKLQSERDLELDLSVKSVEQAGVEGFTADELNQAYAKAAQGCGETAVTQVAGWIATGAGGQGVSQIVEMLGGGAAAASMIDVAVSVKGVQPLDLLAMGINKEMETREVAAPPPENVPAVEDALVTLADENAPASAATVAAEAVGRDIARAPEVGAVGQPDGSLVAEVPTAAYVNKIAEPVGTNVMTIPGLGPSQILFSATDYVPAIDDTAVIDADSPSRPPLEYAPQSIESFVDGLYSGTGGGTDGGTPTDGGTTTTPEGMYVDLPLSTVLTGTDATLTVYCARETVFPATLDVTGASASGVSVSWGSISACPFEVIFNADTAGTYDLGFTLDDAAGLRQTAQVQVEVLASEPVCDGAVHDACVLANQYDRDSCIAACNATYDKDSEQRSWQICEFDCNIADREVGCDCARESGCISQSNLVQFCCERGCLMDNVACLRAIPADRPESDFGSCNDELFTCYGGC